MSRIRILVIVLLLSIMTASGSRAQVIRSGSRGADLDRYMQWAERMGFSGTVLVSDAQGIALHQAYGLADRRTGARNAVTTVFEVGSIAKSFTSAAMVLLQQRGQVRLDDSIGKYLVDVPVDKAGITIEQLLTHSAGFQPDYSTTDTTVMSRDDALRTVLGLELEYVPGTRTEYSDAGYVLAAAIIERVSGVPFTEYLTRELFAPAGMQSTGFYSDPRWARLGAAHGYRGNRDVGSPATWPGPYWSILGGGGLVTTTHDLYQWELAMAGDRILNAQSRTEYFRPRISDGGGSQYALGWTVVPGRDGEEIIKTGSGNLMHHAVYARQPARGVVIIITSTGLDMRNELLNGLRAVLGTTRTVVAPPPARQANGIPEGAYTTPSDQRALLWRDDLGRHRIAIRGAGLVGTLAAIGAEDSSRNRDAVALIEAAMGNNSALVRQVLRDSAQASLFTATVRRFIGSTATRIGDWSDVVALGTVVPWWSPVPRTATIVELRFARGTSIARIEWLPNGAIQLGGAGIPFPIAAYLLPASGGGWQAMDLAQGRSFALEPVGTGALRIGERAVVRLDTALAASVPKRSFAVLLDNALVAGDAAEASALVASRMSGGLADYQASESELNELGYLLLRRGEHQSAILVLGAAAALFPESWNAHDSHGEALAAAGDTAGAIRAYERSLQLNAQNAGGRRALARLQAGSNE